MAFPVKLAKENTKILFLGRDVHYHTVIDIRESVINMEVVFQTDK